MPSGVKTTLPAVQPWRWSISAMVNKKVDISNGYEKYQIEYKPSRIHIGWVA